MTYNFSSPNKRNAEEIVSPPRKEGRFAKAKYYMRAKEGADTNKQKVLSIINFSNISRLKKLAQVLEEEEVELQKRKRDHLQCHSKKSSLIWLNFDIILSYFFLGHRF